MYIYIYILNIKYQKYIQIFNIYSNIPLLIYVYLQIKSCNIVLLKPLIKSLRMVLSDSGIFFIISIKHDYTFNVMQCICNT